MTAANTKQEQPDGPRAQGLHGRGALPHVQARVDNLAGSGGQEQV